MKMRDDFNKGDRVAIINSTMGGLAIVEGFATIVAHSGLSDNHYCVRFEDGEKYDRFVEPSAQADPEAFAERINADVAARN